MGDVEVVAATALCLLSLHQYVNVLRRNIESGGAKYFIEYEEDNRRLTKSTEEKKPIETREQRHLLETRGEKRHLLEPRAENGDSIESREEKCNSIKPGGVKRRLIEFTEGKRHFIESVEGKTYFMDSGGDKKAVIEPGDEDKDLVESRGDKKHVVVSIEEKKHSIESGDEIHFIEIGEKKILPQKGVQKKILTGKGVQKKCVIESGTENGSSKESRQEKRRRFRRSWMIPIHRDRTLSSMNNFINKMACEESGEFTSFCRMSPIDFEYLLNKIEPMIKKQTRLRIPITPKIRLAITLRYLATGDSYKSLHHLFKVSSPAISFIVPEVCRAINIALKDQIKLPQTPEEWLSIEEGFRKKFPHCVGALDGKRVVVRCSKRTGSGTNKKGTCSILLMSLVDSDYRFIFADIGGQACSSDLETFYNSVLWQKIDRDTLNLPPDSPLPDRKNNVPYVFISDGAFPLHKHNIMRPYPGNYDNGAPEHTFNYNLSNTRVVVENAFGVLTSVYGIFRKPIEINPEKVPLLTMTCILLHNFLRKSEFSRNIYTPPGTFDSFVDGQPVCGSWRQNGSNYTGIRAMPSIASYTLNNVSEIQSEFTNYFHNLK